MSVTVERSGDADKLARIREAEQAVAEVERTRDELRTQSRGALGVTGTTGDVPPLRQTLRKYGLSAYPLAALGLLSIGDTFHAYAFSVVVPEVSAAIGVSKSAIAASIALKTLALAIAPLPV